MRIKHNKKRNTAFLYESLVRELTKAVLKKNISKKNKVLSIMKEFFLDETALKRELDLYRTLTEESDLDPPTAERVLWEVKNDYYTRINKKQVFREQTSLIKKINTLLDQGVYSNFVPNYKQLASVHAVFNMDLRPKERVILERNILENLMGSSEEATSSQIKEPVDNLVYKSFVKKFNDMYGESLLKEQKDLLSRYIISFNDNNVGLKIYLNEEIERLKGALVESQSMIEVKEDPEMLTKVNRVMQVLDTFREKTIDKGLVEDVLKIQQLTHEISVQ